MNYNLKKIYEMLKNNVEMFKVVPCKSKRY